MNQVVSVGNKSIAAKEYNGQRVVTFKDIDQVHGSPEGTARKRFNDNKVHFNDGKDFFKIQPSEIRTVGIQSPNGGIVLTESGYLMLVKSLTDNKAWQVQRALVENYFHAKSAPEENHAKIEAPYEYKPLYWRGVQVVTLRDLSQLTGIPKHRFEGQLRRWGKNYRPGEVWLLKGDERDAFKKSNPGAQSVMASSIWILSEEGVEKLAKSLKTPPKALTIWKKQETVKAKQEETTRIPVINMRWAQKELLDVPGCKEAQEKMAAMQKGLKAIETTLLLINRYRTQEDYDKLMWTLREQASYVWDEAERLKREIKPELKNMYT